MSRMKLALTIAGGTIAAGAAGCALGVMFAPASGQETRRRLAWQTEEQWRSVARASGRLLERAATRAREELDTRMTHVMGAA